MPENIYDVKVGDKLTEAQIRAAALAQGNDGSSYEVGATAPNTAEVVSSSQRLSYPLDDADYKARVIFSVLATETTGIGDSFNQIAALADSKAKAVKSQVEDKVAEVRANKEDGEIRESDADEVKKLVAEGKQLKEQQAQFEGLSKQSNTKPSTEVAGARISLYLPMGLAFRDNVTYENFDLGAVGGAIAQGAGIASAMTDGIGSFINGLKGSGSAELAKLAGVTAAKSVLPAEGAAAIKIQGGVTLNPNSRIMFKQPNIREFAFAFKFIARSAEEQASVNQIIKIFRTELYPSSIDAQIGGQTISLGYNFPKKFQLSFEYDGGEIPGLAKIKPCYLRDVSTTFNSSQMAMHKDGNFMEVDMTLSFQETAALTQSDIEDGY
jgi:hypothetical protein